MTITPGSEGMGDIDMKHALIGWVLGIQALSGGLITEAFAGEKLEELANDRRVEILRVRANGGLASNETVHFYVTVGQQGELTGLSEWSEYSYDDSDSRWKLVREATAADLYSAVPIIKRSGRTIVSVEADQSLDLSQGGDLYLNYFYGVFAGYHYLSLKIVSDGKGDWSLQRYDGSKYVPLSSIYMRVRGARNAPIGVADPTEFNTFW